MSHTELDDIRQAIDAIDRDMASLFERRMQQAAKVAAYKQENNLPILDTCREYAVQQRNSQYIGDEELKPYYVAFLKEVMHEARTYEESLIQGNDAATLHVDTSGIVIERGALAHVGEYLDLKRKVLVVSDDGVPVEYRDKVLEQCLHGYSFVFPAGEQSKNVKVLTDIISEMMSHGFTRKDAVVAVGGGVVGDIAGFAAATYMRGIDFYNIPTTLLAQVDSSIGGKTAINFGGVKNPVGAFHNPGKVIVDVDTLRTLDRRIFNEGLAEALKMATTFSRPLFDLIRDTADVDNDIETIVAEALKLKKMVVELDGHEQKLRQVLNFGHTVGHAMEAASNGKLYHGECVGIGMLYFCSESVRRELVQVLEKYGLPTCTDIDADTLMGFIEHDKKRVKDDVNVVYVNEIGTFEFRRTSMAELRETINHS